MVKQPLFGEDSSPHRTSMILSAIITLCAWIVFCCMTFFIKFKPKTPQYKEIQIVLSSEKHEQNQESSSASAPAPMEAASVADEVIPEPAAAVAEPVEAPAPKVETKPAATKTEPAKSKAQTTQTKKTETQTKKEYTKVPEYQSYGKTVEEQMEEQFNKKNYSSKDFDSMFDSMDNSEPEPKVSNPATKVEGPASSFSGSEGNTIANPNQSKSSSQNSSNNNNNSSADKGTIDKLQGIKSATPKTSSKNGINTNFTLEDDTNTIQMSNGRRRRVIVSSPIELSPEAASKIDFKSYTFEITFKVLPSGYILASDVSIKDDFILDQIIIDEIKSQISKWRLEEADYTATASFNFTIKKQ